MREAHMDRGQGLNVVVLPGRRGGFIWRLMDGEECVEHGERALRNDARQAGAAAKRLYREQLQKGGCA